MVLHATTALHSNPLHASSRAAQLRAHSLREHAKCQEAGHGICSADPATKQAWKGNPLWCKSQQDRRPGNAMGMLCSDWH